MSDDGAVEMRRRPWWLLIDRPKAAWSLLPPAVMWGIVTGQANSRGDTRAVVFLGVLAAVGIVGVAASLVYHRRHPEFRNGWPTQPLNRRRTLWLAVGVGLGLICAATGLVILAVGGGPLGVVLSVLGLVATLVCGSTLGEAARRRQRVDEVEIAAQPRRDPR